MNRREFLKSLVVGTVSSLLEIDTILEATKDLSDTDFLTYITWQMNLLVYHPSKCAIISNISEN